MLESANQIDQNDTFSDFPIWENFISDFPENPDQEQPSISLNEDEISAKSNEEQEEQSIPHKNPGGSSKRSNFADDFYRSGTDWSTLNVKVNSSSDPKKLKQTNLFQMWGFKRNKVDDSDGDVDENMSIEKKKLNETQFFSSSSCGEPSSNLGSKSCLFDSIGAQNVCQGNAFLGSEKTKSVSKHSRACPFYKKIPGTSFTVDAFRYGAIKGCSSYFLSHFHADHYGGLSKAWSYGPIYCTPITACLVRMCLSINPSFIHPLELDVEHVIDGIRVTLLEANHCPGAALIHFLLPDGKCYLHTGDFRACRSMQAYPLLRNKHVDVLYLDTTYCNPKYRFPSKEEVLNFVVRTTKACLKRQPKTLIIVGAYSIGKECVYIAISEALRVKIYANASRRRILQSFKWPQLTENLCTNGKDTPLHVMPISSLRHETLKSYLKTYQDQFRAVLAVRPTGWTFSESVGNQLDLIKPNSKGNIQIYGVPYSEHSSFTEMKEFVQFLKPGKIIPTVNNSNAANREKMQSFFRQWLNS